MLDTLGDIISEITRRLGVSTTATYYSSDKIKAAAIQSYMWAVSIYMWPFLEKAKKTVTVANQYYYDYPPKLMSDSITRVIVDGVKYEQKNFDDFLNYRDFTIGVKTRNIFADFGRQVFLFPTPTENDKELLIFGFEEVEPLAENEDESIFTGSESVVNEGIVKKALSILLPSSNRKKEAQAEEQEAIALLAAVYSKILQRQGKYQRLDKPMFNVPDMFGPDNSKNVIGNFDL